MKNPFKNTTFLFGVTKFSKLPDDYGIEILLSGRSNAGKSSALNGLTENKKLARISKTPGRTTEINFFQVNEEFKLLDLPGYGFARSERSKKKNWGPLLEKYFSNRESLKSVLIFMDIRHPLKKLDMEMIALCENYTVPFILVLTKLDKVSRNVCLKTIKDVALKTKNENIFATSALKDMGFEALRKKLISIK